MIYNEWGELFYITQKASRIASIFVRSVYPWWMSGLFVLAGISTAYALKIRSSKEYTKERFMKLGIPLLSGVALVIPVQSYISDVVHFGYKGNYFEHLIVFFTKWTDLTGGDGGFTPGHLWFILYLLVISLITLPLFIWYRKKCTKSVFAKTKLWMLLPYGVIIYLMTAVLDIGGKSIGEFMACYLVGYFVLSEEEVIERIKSKAVWLFSFFILASAGRMVLIYVVRFSEGYDDLLQRVIAFVGILSLIGMSSRYFNKPYKWSRYLSKAAFPLYYFHQSTLVIIAFFTVKMTSNRILQYAVIALGSLLVTLLVYEVLKRFKVTAFLFGIK